MAQNRKIEKVAEPSRRRLFTIEQVKKAKKIRRIIWFVALALFVAIFFIFGFWVKQIFGEDSWIAKVADENGLYADNIKEALFSTKTVANLISSVSAFVWIYVAIGVISFLMRLFIRGSNRRKSVVALTTSFIKYAGYVVLFGMLLSIWIPSFNTTTLLGGTAILALAIGFGAQSLMTDILSGVFIIFENNFTIGDIVTLDEDFRGEVIEIGIRTTMIKDGYGNVKIINNGDIRKMVNMTMFSSVVVCDIAIEYGENIKHVEEILNGNLAKIAKSIPAITEGPFYKGVHEFGDCGVVLRITAKCNESDRFQTTRDMNRELKLLFDKYNINIPVRQLEITGNLKKPK